MTAAAQGSAPGPAAPAAGHRPARVAPLAAAAAQLQRALARRCRPAGEGPLCPVVLPLGAADVLRGPDPRRRAATVQLTARAVLIGPWGGRPDAPLACGHCLAVRWQRLRSRSERDALETGTDTCAVADWPVLPDYLVDAVCQLYAAVFPAAAPVTGRPPGADPDAPLPRVSSVDLATLRVRTVGLLADPLCPSCAPELPDRPERAVPRLVAQPKPAPTAYRRVPAEALPLPAGALVNPVCGVLGAGTVQTLTSPTTAPVSGSVFVRGYAGLLDVTWSGQANSFAGSRALALLEGLERYAGTHRRRPGSPVLDSYQNLGGAALDPAACGLYDAQAYRDDPLAAPFSPAARIPWRWGWSLRDERPILVPQRLCHYSSGAPGDNFVFSTSSGSAIGSSLAEAVLFGLLELIERDAFLLGWYGGARLTGIDLASCRGGRIRAMVERARLQGYDVHAFDNRVDLAVPVVTGLAVRRDGGPGTLSFAAGASLDPETAIEAALAEVLTYIPHLPRQVRRRRAELEAMADDFGLVRQLVDHSALFGLPRMRVHARSYLDSVAAGSVREVYAAGPRPAPPATDLLADLRHCRDELIRAGFDVIVVDQTPPEQERLGLHSVATIVPGLLPIDFGWARQRALRLPRLRTAFRRAGWRATDLTDAELHRVPHPFP